MDVMAVAEGLFQAVDSGDMGEDAQFDLGIVRATRTFALFRDKRLADAAAFLGADRDVLQVGIGRGEAARAGTCLMNRRCERGPCRG